MSKSAVKIRPYQANDQANLEALIMTLYDDEPGVMSTRKIRRTIKELTSHPDKGSIIIFEKNRAVAGYGILIYFWSNEYGGNVVIIDELCLFPPFRNQGIATQFFRWLIRRKPSQCKLLQLEVVHSNVRALKLYKRIGFKSHKNMLMTLEFQDNKGVGLC